MAREAGMDSDIDINIKDGEVFPNGGTENNAGNGKAEQSLQPILDEVQRILKRNRMLLQEIDQKHEAREVGGLNRNVALICELHNNIARVAKIYSDLSRSLAKASPVDVDGTKGEEAAMSELEETDHHSLSFYV